MTDKCGPELDGMDDLAGDSKLKTDTYKELHSRFLGDDGVCYCPLCKAMEKQRNREKKYGRMLCRSGKHETVREDSTIQQTHTVGKDNDRSKDEYYN
jgi:hypothetical protein